MKEGKNDITHRENIQLLVDRFYNKVKSDPLLGPVFSHLDWPHHLPIMYDFWSSMLRAQSIAGIFQHKMGLMS